VGTAPRLYNEDLRQLELELGRVLVMAVEGEPQPSLQDSARLYPIFHYFGFFNNNFFAEQGRQPLCPTPNLEDQVSVCLPPPPRDRVGQVYPQALGSGLFAFDGAQGYGGGILTRLHMGKSKYLSR
jgi:hypothetical protein